MYMQYLRAVILYLQDIQQQKVKMSRIISSQLNSGRKKFINYPGETADDRMPVAMVRLGWIMLKRIIHYSIL